MFDKSESDLYKKVIEMLDMFSKNSNNISNKDYLYSYDKKIVNGEVVAENEEEYVDGKCVKSSTFDKQVDDKNKACTCECGCKNNNHYFKSDLKQYYKSLPLDNQTKKATPSELQVCKLEIAKLKLDIKDYEKEIADLKGENDNLRMERDNLRKTINKISNLLMEEEGEEG